MSTGATFLADALAGALGGADESSVFLSALVSSVDVGLVVVDGERRILLANDEVCRIFGYEGSAASLVGVERDVAFARVASAFADPDAYADRVAEVIAADRPVRGDRVLLADGRVLERDFVPVVAGGRRFGSLWIFADVTREAVAEAALRRHAGALVGLAEAAAAPADERVRAVLAVCCAALDLPAGVVSEVAGDRYVVVEALAPDGMPVARGLELPRPDCACLEEALAGFAARTGACMLGCHPLHQMVPVDCYVAALVPSPAGAVRVLELIGPAGSVQSIGEPERELVALAAGLVASALGV